jgi:uncharacterized protein (TIGR00156 family)
MKGVIVQVGEPKSIALFNNGRIGAIPTPADCHVGMVVTLKYNNKLKIAAFALAAVLLVGMGAFIGVSAVKGKVNTTPPAAGMADAGPPAAAMTDTGRGPAFTVAQAKTLPDDSYVELAGTIDRFLGDEKYIFRDATGSITIEIDHKKRRDFSVGDTVRISGEVDIDREGTVIDVKTVSRIAPP